MTYAVKYLANAYRVAGGNPNRAVALYAGGYYYAAKSKGMLAQVDPNAGIAGKNAYASVAGPMQVDTSSFSAEAFRAAALMGR